MTSQEFVIWLKGFTEGVHEYNITPKQWEILKEKLGQVIGDDNKLIEKSHIGTPIGQGGWGTPNGTDHDLVQRYPWGAPTVWGGAGTAGPPIDCLTTSDIAAIAKHNQDRDILRTSGYVQRTDIPVNTTVTYTTGSGVGYNTVRTVSSPNVTYSTGTAYNPQSGSWHYTDSNPKTLLND